MGKNTDMEIFVAVIDAGGFSPAARRLTMSHSAVSKRIQQLEDRLGVQLLSRTTRSMVLTSAGERYLSEGRRILESIESLEAAVGLDGGSPRGVLKISASVAFGRHHIVPATFDFMKNYPDVHIDLTLTDTNSDIAREGIDVAIRSAALTDSSLVARKLASNDRIICAAPAYLEVNGAPTRPQDLATHACLKLNFQTPFNNWEFHPKSGANVRFGGTFACNNVEALHAACVAGVGIARLPEFIVSQDLATGRLISLLDNHRLPSASAIYAVRAALDFVPAKTTAFIDFLENRFCPVPPWQLVVGTKSRTRGAVHLVGS